MKESELILFVRKDFESIGYTTYGEVSPHARGGEKRCDMYARNENKNSEWYGHTIAFEAKTAFNFKVLEQAYKWKQHANNVYIIVPVGKASTRRSQRFIANKLGIGVIEVDLKNRKHKITVKSEYNNIPKPPKLLKEQRDIASSVDNGEFITEFKLTINSLNNYMRKKKRVPIIDVVRNIKHHYRSNNGAVCALKKHIDNKIIQGYNIVKENNRIYIENTKLK